MRPLQAATSAGTTIVNRAPPSGQFSAEIRPRSTASRPRAIASPIPVPDRRAPGLRAPIEALEEVRQVPRRDTRALIAHA